MSHELDDYLLLGLHVHGKIIWERCDYVQGAFRFFLSSLYFARKQCMYLNYANDLLCGKWGCCSYCLYLALLTVGGKAVWY